MKHHKSLTKGRWNKLRFCEQMANIGSEVGRVINWRKKNNMDYSRIALERALELLDLTITSLNNNKRLKELCRVRECLVDYFYYDNSYGSSDKLWEKYFLPFNWKARVN